jgi:peptide/nickel transport system permease protein
MSSYIIRRFLLIPPTLFGITLLIALLVRSLPGDVVDVLAAEQGYTDSEKAYLRRELGLDKSTPSYYLHWVGNMMKGDFGQSLRTKRDITTEMRRRLPVTAQLGMMAIIFSVCISVPAGVISAVTRNTVFDYIARSLAIFALATPGFWLATLVIVWGSLWLNWTPPLNYTPPWTDLSKNFTQLIIPAILFGLVLAGSQTRLLRATLLEVLHEDYVRTARAKGLSPMKVLWRHALRNSLIPFVTIMGIQIPAVLGGAVVFEQIFTLPGMGTLLLDGLNNRDYTVVQAVNVIAAVMVVMSTLVVDVTYVFLDPRIRLR